MTHFWTTEELLAMLETHRNAAQVESETHHRWLRDEATPYEKSGAEKALWDSLWAFRNHGPEIVAQLLQDRERMLALETYIKAYREWHYATEAYIREHGTWAPGKPPMPQPPLGPSPRWEDPNA